MDSNNVNVFAVIVTYNGLRWIDKCLSSVASSSIPISPIVVDNNSTDGTADFIEENYPGAILIRNTENLGFGKANNYGISRALEAKATHLLLLNQDVYIEHDFLGKLLAFDHGVSLLSPIHLDGSGEKLDHNFKNYTLKPSITKDSTLDNLVMRSGDFSTNVDFVCAACWCIPRIIIETVGGFSPLFPHYGEDNNFIHRLMYHNFLAEVVFGSYVYHDRVRIGNKKVFDSNYYTRRLLLIFSNVNLNLVTITKMLFLEFCKLPYYLLKLRFNAFSSLFRAFLFVFANLPKVMKSRREEKNKGLTWL